MPTEAMMNTTLTMRIAPELKREASRTFEQVGLDLSSAITIFLKKAVRVGGIPFAVTQHPETPPETLAALAEARALETDPSAKRYDDVDGLMAELRGGTEE
jgi:DNA-damage-inducible protein J